MNYCAACGRPITGGMSIGGVLLDMQCAMAVNDEIARLREIGERVDARVIARKMFRETNDGGNYLLRDVPADLMDKAKHRAIDEDCTVRDIIIKALLAYLQTPE